MEPIAGIHHISLTVRDVAKSAAWYGELFGLVEMMREEHEGGHAVVLFQPDTHVFIGLHTHARNDGDGFTETRTGLDHVAFSVERREQLVAWQQRLAEAGVTHSPIADRQYGSILALRDPDDIQLELYAPPTSTA